MGCFFYVDGLYVWLCLGTPSAKLGSTTLYSQSVKVLLWTPRICSQYFIIYYYIFVCYYLCNSVYCGSINTKLALLNICKDLEKEVFDFVCMCVYVCMYACMYVCMHLCSHLIVCAFVFICHQ